MNQAILDLIESKQFRKNPVDVGVGDTVRVHVLGGRHACRQERERMKALVDELEIGPGPDRDRPREEVVEGPEPAGRGRGIVNDDTSAGASVGGGGGGTGPRDNTTAPSFGGSGWPGTTSVRATSRATPTRSASSPATP